MASTKPTGRPPARKWQPQQCKHCIVWAVASDGSLVYVCAHCKKVTKRIDVRATYTPELLMKQCQQSQKQHKTHCLRKRPYPESLGE